MIRVRPSDAPAATDELIYATRTGSASHLVTALPLARSTDRSRRHLMLIGALNWSQTWYRKDRGLAPDRIARRFVGLLKANLAAVARETRMNPDDFRPPRVSHEDRTRRP